MTGDPIRNQAAERAFAELRDRFKDTLEVRLIEFDQAVQWCQERGDVSSFLRLRDLCHRLAGVGASFGFAELGNRARLVDASISRHIATDSSDVWKHQVLAEAEDLMIMMESVLPEQQQSTGQKTKLTNYV